MSAYCFIGDGGNIYANMGNRFMEKISYKELVQRILAGHAGNDLDKEDIILAFKAPYIRQFTGFYVR